MAGPTMNLPAGILRGNGITLSGVGFGSVPLDVLTARSQRGLPRLFAMVAAGELQIETHGNGHLPRWPRRGPAAEPSGTRVVLTP